MPSPPAFLKCGQQTLCHHHLCFSWPCLFWIHVLLWQWCLWIGHFLFFLYLLLCIKTPIPSVVLARTRAELWENWGVGEVLTSGLTSFMWFPIWWPKDPTCCGRASPIQPHLVSWPVPLKVSSPQAKDLPGLATVGPWNCHLQILWGSWLPGLVKS